ncbi:MAG: winged helix-turn-helix transcriptional regulator [Methanomicrobiales archaeon]|nr:winged helix-turn-helix transcriptional regulator [Methanomicrobiales archaeon]
MVKSIRNYSAVLVISLSLALLAPACAAEVTHGYTVEGISPDEIRGEPLEMRQVELWELPPTVIILVLLIPFSSILGFPLELFLFLRLLAFLGYRFVVQDSLFRNAARNRIYTCIRENPGIYFNELVRMTGINRGTIRYHLTLLLLMQRITTLESSGNTWFFADSGIYSDMEKNVLLHLRNAMDCQIFRLLLEKPDITRESLAELLGLSVSTVSWRMKRLCDEELINTWRAGRNVQYGIVPDARPYLEKHLAAVPAVPQAGVLQPVTESV